MIPSASGRTPFILIVDDDEGVREILTDILSDEGYDVVCATSPQQALDLTAERQPDLILVDLLMSGVGGAGFISLYRARPDATAPVLLVSGRADVARQAVSIG